MKKWDGNILSESKNCLKPNNKDNKFDVKTLPILYTPNEIGLMVEDLEFRLDVLKEEYGLNIKNKNPIKKRVKILQRIYEINHKMQYLKGIPESIYRPKGQVMNLEDMEYFGRGHSFGRDLVFLTGRFETGYFLGFWSENPCSTTADQDKGWVVINPFTLNIVEECETRSMGTWIGGFNKWRSEMKNIYGRASILHDGVETNKPYWRMEE